MRETLENVGFTSEQVSTLLTALAKLDIQETSDHIHGTPVDDLCAEEVAKYKQHPLDLWTRLEQWTAKNEIAAGLDQFLLRHLGFFNVEPTSPGYMVRLRLPACQLTGNQMLALADIADRFAGGYSHVTTRGNLQLREIEPKDVLNVLSALSAAGLSCQGSGADSARNITTSPTAGFDAKELMNLAPYAQRLSNAILNTRELRALPRKFNISFDNGGSISAVSDSNDICFQAVNIDNHPTVESGVYCRISLGGISGHKDLARDTGFVCTAEQSVLSGIAMLQVFVAHADRTNRKRARLKYLLDKQGVDWFVAQTQDQLEKLEAGFSLSAVGTEHDLPRPAVDRQAHIGMHPQQRPNTHYVGVALEMGRLSSEQMRCVGNIAINQGHNELRLTVWQNLLIPHLDQEYLPQVKETLENKNMQVNVTAFAAGAIACTGKTACKLGLAHTKEDGLALVRHLEQKFTLEQPINIHLTGCPNSCAQHYIGDIGLVGTTLPNGEPGYHLVVGGGSDQDKSIGRSACGPIAAINLNTAMEQVFERYLEDRESQESFLSYLQRLPDSALPTLVDSRLLAA